MKWNICCTLQSVWIHAVEKLRLFHLRGWRWLKSRLTVLSFFFLDPFGGDPFKESDPFKGTSSDDFFKRTDKSNLFGSSDPFGRKPAPPVKVSNTSSFYHLNVCWMCWSRSFCMQCGYVKTDALLSNVQNEISFYCTDRNKLWHVFSIVAITEKEF